MKDKKFTHLHLHTEYSLLDGSGKISKLMERAKELGMESIAITDHGVMYGCVDFYKEAKAQGIKPILGCEIYVAAKSLYKKDSNDKDNETYHLVLLVKNNEGYENLMKIVSKASIDGFYYKPRVDHEFLREHSSGLIALSACLGGEVQSYINRGSIDKAKRAALLYKDIFTEGFYLELQDHGVEDQRKVNKVLIEFSKELDIPLVATNDVHYIKQEDNVSHDILLCIQTGKTIEEENRMRYPSDQFYLKSPEEMWELFSYIPEALENTQKIAEQCTFDYEFHVSKLPKFPLPEGTDPFEYLREVCYKGVIERYSIFESLRGESFSIEEAKALAEASEEATHILERLEYELNIIKQMGYVDYFLIVWDFIRFANENGIPTGPGRGCFLPGTEVLLSDGRRKPIEQVLIGDKIITHRGRSLSVTNTLSYDASEEITVIKAGNEILKLTNDHEVYSIKTSECNKDWKDRSKLPSVCRNSCGEYKRGHCDSPNFEKYNLQWNKASLLKVNDMVVFPRNKSLDEEILFDLLDYIPHEKVSYDDNSVWYEIGSNRMETKRINRFIRYDEDFAKLLGYFIAEGYTQIDYSSRTYRFGFGFHREEKDYIEEVQRLVQKIFNLSTTLREHSNRLATSVICESKVVALFLRSLCGEVANYKHIPYEVVEKSSDSLIRFLIACMFRGDGSFSDITCNSGSLRIKYTTTSMELAYQLRMILARVGYWGNIKRREKSQENWHEEYSICLSGAQLLSWNDDFPYFFIPIKEQKFYRNDGFYVDDNYIYMKVKEVGREEYSGKVYDLSVEEDTSYVANSMAVHNSAAGAIVAYALGITKIDPIEYSLIFERELRCAL